MYVCGVWRCVSVLAPSRGGVLQLRGNPVHGALSETRVTALRTRTPPGLGLSSP